MLISANHGINLVFSGAMFALFCPACSALQIFFYFFKRRCVWVYMLVGFMSRVW